MHKLAAAVLVLSSSLALAGPEQAEEHYKFLHEKCGPTLKMSKSECACIVLKAKAELQDPELELVVMYVKQDKAGIAKAQGQLNGNQVLKAISFVAETPTKCKNK